MSRWHHQPSASRRARVGAAVVALLALPVVGAVQSVQAASPPPAPPGASELRTDGANLDPSIDSVAAGTALNALRAWQFTVGNNVCGGMPANPDGSCPNGSTYPNATTNLNGAQVAIDTSGTCSSGPCPNLTATNPGTNQPEFTFFYSNPSVGGNLANGPGATACPAPAPTATQETCPTGGVTIAPSTNMTVFTAQNPQSGVPISMTTGYDSSRALGATAGNGDAPFTLSVTLNDARYTIAANDNQIFVNTFSDNADTSAPLTVTATPSGGPSTQVQQCPPTPTTTCWQQLQFETRQVPQQGGGTVTCNSVGMYLHRAQNGTTYALNAQENQTAPGCASGKPGVGITATSQTLLSSSPVAPCDTGTNCTATLSDPTLGNVRFTVGSGQVSSFQTFQEVNYALQYFPQAPPPPPAPPVFVDQRLDTANLDPSVDSVVAAQSLSELRAWQFSAGNFRSTPINGAQMMVDTSGTNLDLTNPSQFGFSYSNPGNTGGGGNNPCTPSSTSHITCPPSGVTLAPNSGMNVFSSPNPQTGVPLTQTTGYNASRALGPTGVGGDTPATVSITLVDSAHYPSANDSQILVSTFGDNVDTSSPPTVMGNGSPVPSCPQPAGTACVQQLQFQSRPIPGGGTCNSVFLSIDRAQLTTLYTLTAQEHQTNAGGCPTGKPAVRLSAVSQPPPQPAGPCTDNGTVCTVTVNDAALGAVAFSVASGQTSTIQTAQQPDYVVQFTQQPQCPSGCGGPPPLSATDTRIAYARVPGGSDSYSAIDTSAQGYDNWFFDLRNAGSNPVSGATIAVASNGPNLQDSSQFGFSTSSGTPCAPPTPTSETCVDPNPVPQGGRFDVAANAGAPDGVPISGYATGYASARHTVWTGSGMQKVSVPVTLSPASTNPVWGPNTELQVGIDGNFSPSSGGTVTAGGAPLPACPPPSPGPPPGPCQSAQPFNGGPCQSIALSVHQAQAGVEYTFSATQTVSFACGVPAEPRVRILANAHHENDCPPPGCGVTLGPSSATISDPALGTITYSVAGPSGGFSGSLQDIRSLIYPPVGVSWAAGGAFVIGDGSAAAALSNGGEVNFWGSQWAGNNVLSGGAAPNAFKGFATSSQPPDCGSRWTSRPGNSSDPQSSISDFMYVVVASSVTKSGSQISGDVVHVVIVQTEPGYAGNPGHPGFGHVVAQVC
jgi:hypothetical protein